MLRPLLSAVAKVTVEQHDERGPSIGTGWLASADAASCAFYDAPVQQSNIMPGTTALRHAGGSQRRRDQGLAILPKEDSTTATEVGDHHRHIRDSLH